MRPRHMEVYRSRWASQSSKLLHGGPRRRGWVRLPYASALNSCIFIQARADACELATSPQPMQIQHPYNIPRERAWTGVDNCGFSCPHNRTNGRGCCMFSSGDVVRRAATTQLMFKAQRDEPHAGG